MDSEQLVCGGGRHVGRFPLGGSGGAESGDLGLEVLHRLVVPVHGREAQVGDRVQLAERAEDRDADVVGGDLGAPAGAKGLLDLLAELGQVMSDASICGLGQAAALAIVSARRRWPDLLG